MRIPGRHRLQIRRHAGKRAARAGCGAKSVDLARGVVPDLGPGGFEVREPVGRVVELIGPDRIGKLRCQPSGHFLILVRVAVGNGGHLAQLRAQGLDDLIFLRGLIVRHDDDALVAARVAHMREPDAGVAGSALHDRAFWLEHAAPFGIEHDPLGRTVLDRASRIHEFGLAENLAAGLLAEGLEPNERCAADRPGEAVRHCHVAILG